MGPDCGDPSHRGAGVIQIDLDGLAVWPGPLFCSRTSETKSLDGKQTGNEDKRREGLWCWRVP